MTLSLYLLRHAKSDQDAAFERDHDRPLAERGVAAARRVGELLASAGEQPDLVLASSAVRALTTAQIAAEAGGWDGAVRVLPELYEATPESVVATIRSQGGVARRLCVVGHEPTTSALLGALVGGAAVRVPTAGLARIDFASGLWEEIAAGRGVLRWLVTPKLLT